MAKARTIVRYRSRPRGRPHRRAKTTIPLAVVGGFVPLMVSAYRGIQESPERLAQNVVADLTGYNIMAGAWQPAHMRNGLLPIMIGFGVHKAASMIGVNRALGRAKIPLLRI